MIAQRRRLAAMLVLVGCGRDLHHTIDGGPIDAPPDIPVSSNDPPASAVKLRVIRNGQPVNGVTAWFQSDLAASTVVASAQTNEQGLAWAELPTGGYVTAIERGVDGIDEVTTFAGVQPADDLRLVLAPTGDPTFHWFRLVIPQDSGATSYVVDHSCAGEPIGVDATLAADVALSGCDATVDFVISSLTDGVPTGRALYAGAQTLPAPPAPEPNDAMPPPLGMLTLTGTYQALETHTLSYANVPATLFGVHAYQALSAERRAFEAGEFGAVADNAATVQLAMPVSTATLLTVTTGYPTSGEHGQPLVFDWGVSSATSNLDVGAALLPAYASAPTFDSASRTITWTERTATTQPDLVRARIHVFRDDIPQGRSWGWRIVAPRAGAAVTYPELPVVDFDYNPGATDTAGVGELTVAKLPGGFAAWRQTAFADFTRAVTGTSGRIVLQTRYVEEL